MTLLDHQTVQKHGLHRLRLQNTHRALKSNGTLLPLPALYFLVPPINSLGFGNNPSSLNCHLGSLITTRPPPPTPGVCAGEPLGLVDWAPLAVNVNILGSNIDCRRDEPRERVLDGVGEGALGGAGADPGGGGGGAETGDT